MPLLQDPTSRRAAITQLVIFNVVTFLLIVCYIRCALTAPGGIPSREEDPHWEYAAGHDEMEALQEKKKRTGERRHCKWCAKYKPDRCHHCRVCQKCMLKMDHHCPWIYNCVGFRNHKYFWLLLFYSSIDCLFIFFTMLRTARDAVDEEAPFAKMFCLLFGVTLAAFLGLLVTAFWLFHVWLMLKGMSTIEFCEKSIRESGYQSSPYSKGLAGNIRGVLGDHILLWLVPVNPPVGDGLFFSEETRLAAKAKKPQQQANLYGSISGWLTEFGGQQAGQRTNYDEDPFLTAPWGSKKGSYF